MLVKIKALSLPEKLIAVEREIHETNPVTGKIVVLAKKEILFKMG